METDQGAARYSSPTLDADTSFLLARASAMASAVGNRAVADLGLKVRTYSVLALAVEVEPSQRELAERLRLDPSQIVALVDELEARGLLERRQDPSDRRARIVAATPAGAALFGQARARIEDAQRDLWAPHSAPEIEALRAMLRRVAFGEPR
ncbi:MarR family transcriptional regulator [Demequina sp. SYSU T00192]|uniref:MarR family transcriptional regulator n=1 Tax=Demequina litoralis TaxID=3051660 RepID=A0ABT8GCN6_9MICO|nr:MarR family transcriptional regulator [Demequina sp. SYSU T00192]MDN4476817.1 MarR family transcriptional regulator [Demequina sp. SYSU T00192]